MAKKTNEQLSNQLEQALVRVDELEAERAEGKAYIRNLQGLAQSEFERAKTDFEARARAAELERDQAVNSERRQRIEYAELQGLMRAIGRIAESAEG